MWLKYQFPLRVPWRCARPILERAAATAAAKTLQSCPTLCHPIDGSPPGSTIPGILQPRTLEWVAISFSNAWKWKVKVKSLSCARLIATQRTAAHQAPLSMGFSRQEYWSGVPLPSPLERAEEVKRPSAVLQGNSEPYELAGKENPLLAQNFCVRICHRWGPPSHSQGCVCVLGAGESLNQGLPVSGQDPLSIP